MTIVVANTPQSDTMISGVSPAAVQQAAIDISLDRVWAVKGDFFISEDLKQHRELIELPTDSDDTYHLQPGVYEVSFENVVSVGEGEAGLIVTRSSLARNGLSCVSGLYDPKYSGVVGCALHVRGGPAKIKKGTRLAQFVVWKVANPQGAYDGDYGFSADGEAKQMEQRYNAGAQ